MRSQGADVDVVRGVERHADRGLALALPSLMAVSCLLPLLGLLLRSLPFWVAPGVVCMAAVGVCTYLLRERGVARAIGLAVVSVLAGAVCLDLVSVGLTILGNSNQSGNDAANIMGNSIPILLAILDVVAIVLSFRALPAQRRVLGLAWVVAVATPFMLWSPVSALSESAGNAGMDAVGLLTIPLAAYFAWGFLFAGSALWPSIVAPSATPR